jgi:hypothetical protein
MILVDYGSKVKYSFSIMQAVVVSGMYLCGTNNWLTNSVSGWMTLIQSVTAWMIIKVHSSRTI